MAALAGTRSYVGDGVTVRRSMVRRSDDALVGPTPLRTQLGWCQNEGMPRPLLTHGGSEIAEGDERCPRCGGPIERVDVSGRGAYLCPACQPRLGEDEAGHGD